MGNTQPVQPSEDVPMSKADSLLTFNMREKKHEIFEEIRECVHSKAQYTKSGRKPWTQITAYLPIVDSVNDNDDHDDDDGDDNQ
jgi:hypothetical protein